jgi:hypothetical protein
MTKKQILDLAAQVRSLVPQPTTFPISLSFLQLYPNHETINLILF